MCDYELIVMQGKKETISKSLINYKINFRQGQKIYFSQRECNAKDGYAFQH